MYHYLYVGVASLRSAAALWRDVMGLETLELSPGYNRTLERLWGMKPQSIAGIMGLQTPDAPAGRLIFIEFSEPSATVRDGADVTDLCPKNLDANVVDLPLRAAELKSAGYHLRSEPVEFKIGELDVREVQLPIHDDINLVLTEIVGESFCTTSKGYGGVTSVVTTVGDIEEEQTLLEMLGFSVLDSHQLSGPEIEQVIGLPSGGQLHMQLLGEATHRFGRAELIKYIGAPAGVNRYVRAAPPARGLLRAATRVPDIERTRSVLVKGGFACGPIVTLTDIDGSEGLAFSVTSPVGWAVDVWTS